MHTFQFCRYLRKTPGEHTYLPRKTGIFPIKIVSNCFCITKIRLGEISLRKKGISEQFCQNKQSNNDPNESNTINQANTN